jgi:aryl-alcohol dehydrogenase-like predicted oxidoreductase
MHYRNLGHSGLKVSAIGLGTNRFGGKVDQPTVNDILAAALDLGINLIDTADVYQKGHSEETIGKAIHNNRSAYLIATKFRHPVGEGPNDRGASRHHLMESVHASLRRLDTDYIDLYQVHSWDGDTPLEETMRALDDLIRAGKVRYLGASNFSGWQLTRANTLADFRGWTPFVSIQPHYHMFERGIEKELIPASQYLNVGLLPYFPLAGGFLTGKYQRGEPAPAGSRGEESPYVQKYMKDEYYDKLDQLTAFAESRARTLGELAHAWLLAQPQVTSVISGATKVAHVQANAKGGDWLLTGEDEKEVRGIIDK